MRKTIRELFHLDKHKGDLGVEIEVEGVDIPRSAVNWRAVPDGSLRGESMEYVTKSGVTIDNLDDRIENLKKAFKKTGGVINPSVRAGVHVHINVQELTITQLACFATLYYTFEDLLLKFCGDNREGNLFCLRVCDADYVIDYVIGAINGKNFGHLNSDKIRYAAMNWKPLMNYGSLEFRAMRTDPDLNQVSNWAKLLYQLLQSSYEYERPEDVIADFSLQQPNDFIEKVFKNYTKLLDVNSVDLYQGCCNAQDFAFGVDWSRVE